MDDHNNVFFCFFFFFQKQLDRIEVFIYGSILISNVVAVLLIVARLRFCCLGSFLNICSQNYFLAPITFKRSSINSSLEKKKKNQNTSTANL